MRSIRVLVALIAILGFSGNAMAQHTGVAPNGEKGRLHVVVAGDTLWDLSSTYLGTPWIWPSMWKENEIENPHLINPGDLIWITEAGMRKVTAEEARRLTASAEETPPPAELDESSPPLVKAEPLDPFASLDSSAADAQRVVEYPGLHRFSYVTEAELVSAGSLLGSHAEEYWTSQERRTIVSLGEGQAEVGDRYTIFRTRRRVIHPETGKMMGYFAQIVGTAEVSEVHPETSYVKIIAAYAEIEPGDRLIPYVELPREFKVVRSEGVVAGVVLAHMPYRQYTGEGDLVIIDRGTEDGVEPGRQLELYRAGKEVVDPVSRARLMVPDDRIGQMFVLRAGSNTAVALIQRANRPVRVGDHYRDL